MRYKTDSGLGLRYLLNLIVLTLSLASSIFGTAPVSKGILDLRNKDNREFVADLKGEWRFYWNKPESVDLLADITPDGYFAIPGYWAGYKIRGKSIPDSGYGTFSLTVFVSPDQIGRPFALETPDQLCAYAVWVDGKKVSVSGNAATSEAETISRANTNIVSFTPESRQVEIVMRVSNFNSGGGPHKAPSIGTHKAVLNRFAVRIGLDLLFLGALLLVGFFHLGLYSMCKEMKSYLYMSIFALSWSLRFFIEGIHYRPITFLFPDLSYEVLSRLEVIFATPTSYLLLLFVYTLFPQEQKRNWLRFSLVTSACLFLASISFPIKYVFIVIILFQLLSFLLVYPLYSTIIKAVQNRRDGALLVLCGILCFTLAAVNDSLFSLRIIDTAYIISIGIVILALFFSAVLSRRFAHAFSRARQLSRELEEKNESLKQLDHLKDEFIANTSHELRTPLQGIVGLAESLLQQLNTQSSHEMTSGLSLIAASGRRLAYVINDIQDLSQIKEKNIRLMKKAVDIKTCASTVIALSEHLRRSEDVAFENILPKNFPLVYGDEVRIEQILYNIVGNAVKYTPSGSITVSGFTREGEAVISVEDTGTGIRKDKLDSLFMPYKQVGGGEQQAGTGIGLSITKHLVELHGGTISATSRYGEGSCFTFTIPLASEGSNCDKRPAILSSVLPDITLKDIPKECNEPVPKANGTVLVVDDDPVNRKVLTTILSQHYASVIEACDGIEALSILKQHSVDLVLLDIMMPRLDGYETLGKIRQNYSRIELPVLFLTAKNRSIDLVTGFRAGANDYLTKPCGNEELLARVNSQLQASRAAALKEENQKLARIVEAERQLQQESLVALGRIESVLDTLSDPVALIDETHVITYANRAFCILAGIDSPISEGVRIDQILSDAAFLRKLDDAFLGEEQTNFSSVVQTPVKNNEHTFNLAVVTAGDESLVMISSGGWLGQQDTAPIANSGSINGGENRRDFAKRAINEAVRLWSEETGLSPLELARQSGLWKVHMNPDGWERAKTFDRYLSNSDFPQNPRLKTIVATLAFVLEKLGPDNSSTSSLKRHIKNLQKWV